jgi:NAD(P)-dependent dehydrogenase (short-subunit alcohol dehydrogenase family)
MTRLQPDPTQRFRLDDRVAVITGASSGLGAHFARLLAAVGARVVLAARRRERIEALAAELPGAVAVACDVSRAADNERLIETAIARCGGVDLLVNNAGITEGPKPALETPLSEFHQVLAVDLVAAFQLSQLAARSMLARGGGSIVNIASIHGLVAGAPNSQAAYVAAKGGLVNLTRELGCQWARQGIRVNAIAPAYFETEITAEMFADERSMSWLRRNTPMGRPGKLDELDGALLFLASGASSYVTGTTLAVDGGWTAR